MNEATTDRRKASNWKHNVALAEMLKGGVIMDVVTAEHAKIAEETGAAAVMALERVPADIRAAGGVARMSDPKMIREIQQAVSIPVMAKCRIGHFVEAQILEALEVDFIDESEVLTPADETYHVDKFQFRVPFVCGCRNLGEALRRIGEGAAMIRTRAKRAPEMSLKRCGNMRTLQAEIRAVRYARRDELMSMARDWSAPHELLLEVQELGRLPVPNFSAGGVATPADAALMMGLGAESVFVGSGILSRATQLNGPRRLSKP